MRALGLRAQGFPEGERVGEAAVRVQLEGSLCCLGSAHGDVLEPELLSSRNVQRGRRRKEQRQNRWEQRGKHCTLTRQECQHW